MIVIRSNSDLWHLLRGGDAFYLLVETHDFWDDTPVLIGVDRDADDKALEKIARGWFSAKHIEDERLQRAIDCVFSSTAEPGLEPGFDATTGPVPLL